MNLLQRKLLCGVMVVTALILNVWVGDWSMEPPFYERATIESISGLHRYMHEGDSTFVGLGIIAPIGLLGGAGMIWAGKKQEQPPSS